MKTIYTCPMHPEIQQATPGKCPKCGDMDLVPKDSLASHVPRHATKSEHTWKSYLPLIVIISLILLTTFTLSFRDISVGVATLNKSIMYFMTGFFLVFSGFKLMDLKGFAQGYSTYDLLAKRWYLYGYIYPFLELFFGLAMILWGDVMWLLGMELVIMTFSGVGVARKLLRHERFQCACLGTFLNVPLTKVTLIEDFGMALLALLLLVL